MKERLEDFASAQEKRAYIQGYGDCVQALYHMGLLKDNEGPKWAEKVDQKQIFIRRFSYIYGIQKVFHNKQVV